MKTADEYRKTWPNKTDDQIIESLGNEVRDKVETIHGLLHDLNEKEYTEEDMYSCWQTAFTDAMNISKEGYKPLWYSDYINSLNK